jgi:NAD(P)-dependent dehydrogenase (short-subunit alcohol dehydrogenase family)
MNISLSNKVALVTGAGAGIGKGCALELARSGADVIVNDMDAATGNQTVAEIKQLGREAVFHKADISSEAQVAAMAKVVGEQFGALHILVNNAGCNLFKGIADTTPAEWDRVTGVDLRGIYLVIRAFLPMLKKANGASVINIASVHATVTVPNIAAYASAKGGVVALTRSIAQELGPFAIRVNAVSPGFIRTPMVENWLKSEPDPEASLKRVNSLHPLGRIGTPQDIGRLIVFLGSEMSGFITAADVKIDGALSARLMH